MSNTFKDFLYNSDSKYKTIGKSFAQWLMEAEGDSKEGYEYEEDGKTYRVIKRIKDGKEYYTKQEKIGDSWGKEEQADDKLFNKYKDGTRSNDNIEDDVPNDITPHTPQGSEPKPQPKPQQNNFTPKKETEYEENGVKYVVYTVNGVSRTFKADEFGQKEPNEEEFKKGVMLTPGQLTVFKERETNRLREETIKKGLNKNIKDLTIDDDGTAYFTIDGEEKKMSKEDWDNGNWDNVTIGSKNLRDQASNNEKARLKKAKEEADKAANGPGKPDCTGEYEDDNGNMHFQIEYDGKTYDIPSDEYTGKNWKPKESDKELETNDIIKLKEKTEAYARKRQSALTATLNEPEVEKEGASYKDKDGNTVTIIKTAQGYKQITKNPDGKVLKTEPSNEEDFKWAVQKQKQDREADDLALKDDFEGEEVNKDSGIKIVGKKNESTGKIEYQIFQGKVDDNGDISFDNVEPQPVDKSTALKVAGAIRANRDADFIANASGKVTEKPVTVEGEEKDPKTGEIIKVKRKKIVTYDGKVIYKVKRGDNDWEDAEQEGGATLFDNLKQQQAANEIAATQIPKAFLPPEGKNAESIAKVKDDDGNITITVKDKDGKVHQWVQPKDAPADWKPSENDIKSGLSQDEFQEQIDKSKEQYKKESKMERGDLEADTSYVDDDGNKIKVEKYVNGKTITVITQKYDAEGKPIGDPVESHDEGDYKNAKAIADKKKEEARAIADSNEIPQKFTYMNSKGEKVEMESKKDADGKMHYYKNGEECNKSDFDNGKKESDADEKRAKELKQKEEDRKREIEKKREDKLLDGKSSAGNEKREPSEAKKAWDNVVDKMSNSKTVFGRIIGNTAKVITGIMSTILPPNPKKAKKVDDELDKIALANIHKMIGENDLDSLDDEEKDVIQNAREDVLMVVNSMTDDEGNPLSPEERLKKLKGDMSDEEFEEWKNKHVETFNKVKDIPEFKEFFDKNDNLTEEQINELRSRITGMEEEARDPVAKKIKDKRDNALKEESEKGKNDQKALDDEHGANLEGLKNYEEDVKNAQKELDSIKKEDDESDEMYEARKKQAQTRLNNMIKARDDKKDEIEADYKDKCSKLRKERIEAKKKINEEFEKEMQEAGKDTIRSLAEKAAKKAKEEEEKNSDDFDRDKDDDSKDMEDDASEGEDKVPNVDPRKTWKQRMRKDGNGKTKSYWNKKGNAKISEKEFKQKCKLYDEKNNGKGSDNSECLSVHLKHYITESITEYLISKLK